MVELSTSYNPSEFESSIYDLWLSSGCFSPQKSQDGASPFVIVMPPPNVTGILHLGHALNNNLQDILVRYYRMKGRAALWVPGTDHAGIATQHLVEKMLSERGMNRKQLGRDAFIKEVWRVKEQHHALILAQLRKFGSSCDWSRERFTLDDKLSSAVQKVFLDLYERNLIYKGNYLVNWSVGLQSAISDDEVDVKELNGFFYYILYPLADGAGYVELATTRPETMLGDTAVAVHPDDQRYRSLIGRTLNLPLCGREIPIIADVQVDPEFGTGVVKITPAHSFSDYEMGIRHNLPLINIMNPDGTLNTDVPSQYRGLSMKEAREAVIADLDALGLLKKREPHRHLVGHCYRSNTIVEPYVSTQWFVRMKPLATQALKALEDKKIHFFPKKWENTYSHWLNEIRDWCISRQLWWGHRIPAWYDNKSGDMVVSATNPALHREYADRFFTQDEDVLDTWFSSWLWPFSVMGWPEKSDDMKTFFPTSSLVTGYDIIFFWVTRMIMASQEFLGEVPFRDIYITGLVRDKSGRKMSKSLGNGLDPVEIVDEYGSDSLRFTLAFLATQGQDIFIDRATFSLGSRFANKIWNAARYLFMNLEEPIALKKIIEGGHLYGADRWILTRLNNAAERIDQAFSTYRFSDAATAAQEFFWNEYCDWYIEISKSSLYSNDHFEKRRVCALLVYLLEESLKLLHPFLPHITEEIFQKLHSGQDRLLMTENYPVVEEWRNFPCEGFESVRELVRNIRVLRSEFTVLPSIKVDIAVCFDEDFSFASYMRSEEDLVCRLTNTRYIEWRTGRAGLDIQGAVAVPCQGFEVFVYIATMVDIEAVITRFEKSIDKELRLLEQSNRRLANEGFLSKASADVIEHEQRKQEELSRRIAKRQGYIEDLKR